MLLLLDLLDGSVLVKVRCRQKISSDKTSIHHCTSIFPESYLEGESVDVSLLGAALDSLGLFKNSPPLGEELELDQVPDIGQGLSKRVKFFKANVQPASATATSTGLCETPIPGRAGNLQP